MQTLKKGSKGQDVITLQNALIKKGYTSIKADGDFGAKTETVVKSFQKAHNLLADGIVGNGTWKALGVISEPLQASCQSIDKSIVYNPLKVHITKCSNRSIKYLAIHFTAGAKSIKGSANNLKGIFESRSASADFGVDDETMVQFNPDINNYYCWAVGDSKNKWTGGGALNGKAVNKNTVSIEICSNLKRGTTTSVGNHAGWSLTDESINKAVQLSKIIMSKFNIPIENVIRHYDVTGKLCPGIIGWNDGEIYDESTGKSLKKKNNSDKWNEFKKQLIK